jgi:uncharacterized protein with HEPN domain
MDTARILAATRGEGHDRPPTNRIRDIQTAIAAIRQFEAAGRDQPMVFDAVRMRLLEIGEAANGIPPELRDSEPSVPWREIIGMRNWMAHRYFDTAHAYIWTTVDNDLDPLLAALERLADSLDEGG